MSHITSDTLDSHARTPAQCLRETRKHVAARLTRGARGEQRLLEGEDPAVSRDSRSHVPGELRGLVTTRSIGAGSPAAVRLASSGLTADARMNLRSFPCSRQLASISVTRPQRTTSTSQGASTTISALTEWKSKRLIRPR